MRTINQSTIWSDPAALAAQIIARSIKRVEDHEKSKARAAEKQTERRAAEKKS